MPFDELADWWQFDDKTASMVHMVTGEQVLFRGEIDLHSRLIWQIFDEEAAPKAVDGKPDYNPGWFRFDYVFEGELYPILVGMGLFAYPNPDQMPKGDGGRMEEDRIGPRIRGWVWIIDHNRSLELRRSLDKTDAAAPDYGLWKRADRAITEVAFLWPGEKWWEGSRGQRPAREIALRGGWFNGIWRTDLQRRVGTEAGLLHNHVNPRTLPLSDFALIGEATSEQWTLATQNIAGSEGEQREWRLVSRPGGHGATVTLVEREPGPPPRIKRTDKSTGVSTEIVLERGPLIQSFTVTAKLPTGSFCLNLEKRSELEDPARSYDGIGRPLLPFGADWRMNLRSLSYAQSLAALDFYTDALMPLTNGLLGSFMPPTLLPACIALYGVPIAGNPRGIMAATLAGILPHEKARLGWDDFFF